MILAGAGSGKTRVITHRIAWLVGPRGVDPRRVVAMTFTNKAAGEMRARAERLLGQELAGAFLGTFHAFGLRLLRRHAPEAGFPSGFVVYDTADQQSLVKAILKDLGREDQKYSPREVLAWISRQKNSLRNPESLAMNHPRPDHSLFLTCFAEYENRLRRAGAVDFDDLLLQVIALFRKHPGLAERYARQIEWLLVDEYQDTNPMQYALIQHLAARHQNLCCVGDEDQSIYRFRGADIRNILSFTRDFPRARVIKLEQNYRSTTTILEAAAGVISRNTERHPKALWTENRQGEPIRQHLALDDREEADFVVGEMLRLARAEELPLDDMAVLYRTNACSRLFEDRLTARGLAYRVIGSLRFYERKEIKDLLAWVRLLVHPDADEDFLRAAQTPPRGLGAATLQEVSRRARQGGRPLTTAAQGALADPQGLSGRALGALGNFLGTLADLRTLVEPLSTRKALIAVAEALDFAGYLEQHHPADFRARMENIAALVSAAGEHDEAGAPGGLVGFLDRVSLRSDTDEVAGTKGPLLMTVHSAKGLEFDVVFLAGLNQDLFPHSLSKSEAGGIEEERRLMYVALTRARRHLFLTYATTRFLYGKKTPSPPSEFLADIPPHLLKATFSPALHTGAPAPRLPAGRWSPVNAEKPTAPAGIRGPTSGRKVEFDAECVAREGTSLFRVGMRVRHPQFGCGVILQARGQGERLVLKIHFDQAGQRRIMPSFVTLMPA